MRTESHESVTAVSMQHRYRLGSPDSLSPVTLVQVPVHPGGKGPLALLPGHIAPAGACSQGCGPPWWQASVCSGSATQDLCIHAGAW